MNMEISILIQIIASSVLLTGIVLGFVFTWIKGGNFVKVVRKVCLY